MNSVFKKLSLLKNAGHKLVIGYSIFFAFLIFLDILYWIFN